MKLNKIIVFALIFFGVFGKVCFSQTQSTQERKPVFLYVNKNNICGYSNKNINSRCLKKLWWGSRIRVTEEQYKNLEWNKNTWFKVKSFSLSGVAPWWIKSKYITSEISLKKLDEGWPIKSISMASGDFGARVEFKKDGQAIIESMGKKNNGHVFIGKGVIIIKYPEPSYESTLFIAGYDPKIQKTFITSVPEGEHCKVEFFKGVNILQDKKPRKNLKDCSRLP